MKVLLVEDDEKLGLLIEHFLKEEKFKTDWVKNGKDAIYYAQNENYDIIILDWMLPKEDGIEVCQRFPWQAQRHQAYAPGGRSP